MKRYLDFNGLQEFSTKLYAKIKSYVLSYHDSAKQDKFAEVTQDGGDDYIEPTSSGRGIYLNGKFRHIPDTSSEANEHDIVNRAMLEAYHDDTKQGNWRTIADTTLSTESDYIDISVDSNNNLFVLEQIRIYLYVPMKADATNPTNGYLNLQTVGQSGYYISFGAPNFISKTADNYWLIEILPSNSFPACAKFSVSRPATTGNVQTYFDRNGHSANNYTAVLIKMNQEALPVGTHIIIEGVDA